MSNPIRVLCLFTIMNRGGAETMCMNLYRHIDRTKVQFDFLVYYDEAGSYDDEIRALGGKIFHIPHPKYISKHIHGAKRFFADHPEYCIIHNHMQSNGSLICMEAKKAGVPTIIYHSHSGPVPLIEQDLYHTLRRVLSKGITAGSLGIYTDFFACGETAALPIPEKYHPIVIKNAIEIEKFRYNATVRARVRETCRCEDHLVIGNVARFDNNKNQRFAVEIMKEVIKEIPNAELWLIGDGETKADIQSRAEACGLDNYIKFWGIRDDVSQLLQAMDVYLFPSIREGLPVACIEAQAAGLPCVFSDGFDPTTSITKNCKSMSLKEPPKAWANTVLGFKNFQRQDTSEQIRTAGYDILKTSKMMEDFYIAHRRKGEVL